MAFSFRFELIEKSPTAVELKLRGVLEAGCRLPKDHDFSAVTKLEIDFQELEFMNSGGIKVWINFVDLLNKQPQLNVSLKNCGRIVIHQANRILGFIPERGRIESFYAPVFCSQCDQTLNVYLKSDQIPERAEEVKKMLFPERCSDFPECRQHWEIDFHPSDFFKFKTLQK